MNRNEMNKAREEMLKIKAWLFKFNGTCPNCEENMREFTSEDKSIFLCEHCGCIYVPENIRNIKISTFKYERLKGILIPVCQAPTEAQLKYLKLLVDETGISVDFNSITKEEAKVLIDKLRRKVRNKEIIYE